MGELTRREEEFPAAELARDSSSPKQPEGPKVVKGQEPGTPDRSTTVSGTLPLLSEPEMGDFRSQWSKVQTCFVDEPRGTVEDADTLVAAVMQRLAEGFANERSGLEKQLDRGDKVSTEDLRVALRRYRSFFDRLLKLREERASDAGASPLHEDLRSIFIEPQGENNEPQYDK
jgi:hypothetical protein